MQKGESNQSTKISLAYSLVSLYFGLWRVSLAEYILILRVLFTLLQMMSIITATVLTVIVGV